MKIGKKIVLMVMAILLLTVGAVAAYGTTFWAYSSKAISKTYKKIGEDSTKDNIIQATKPFTILLMGVDVDTARGGGWEGRSDSLILVTVNPQTKKTTLMSLTRDIMVEIANPDGTSTGTAEKLNHTYSYGQAPMTIATVEKMMDIDIDRYVQINMDGLVSLVDALGGITVNNTLGFPISISAQEPNYTSTVDPGQQLVNGDQALVYARMRYDDPEGDVGRQRRQREVIGAIATKLLQLDGFTQYKNILDAVSTNLQTDIEINAGTIPSLLGYKDSLNTIESYQLDGEGEMVEGLSYQIPTSKHLLEMQNVLKRSLGLPEATELKTNVRVYEKLFGLSNPYTVIDAYTGLSTPGTGIFDETVEVTTEVSEAIYTQ
ncbi:LytR family transcriptional regulator [Streptococcus minor]|uniref:LytR family transcriptional regulator n=1 Tax=Streptococcus minor TaxID=229549 RepID=A0A3P1VAU6_9STRE|nr:LCP family protein [Streptococcus minor]RRD31352.1 LytR family transcriptional regulator [Streptococcus minor]